MAKGEFYGPLERVDDTTWKIPKSYKEGMRVDGLIYADERMIEQIRGDQQGGYDDGYDGGHDGSHDGGDDE